MKKLIPALCMLLVAACLMGTSTYAWFAANTTVSASGMAVQAISEGGLAIAVQDTKDVAVADVPDTAFLGAIEAPGWTNEAEKIAPTSKDTTGAWWKATSTSPSSYVGSGYGTVGSTEEAKYFYQTQVYIKTLVQTATAQAPETLYVKSVSVTGGTGNALDSAVRVAVECGGKWYFFAPNYDAANVDPDDLYFYDGDDTNGEGAKRIAYPANSVASGAMLIGTGGTNGWTSDSNTLASLTYDVPVLVNIYLYYEGEDENCKSQLATNITDVELSITFEAN